MSKNASDIVCPKCGMPLSANDTFCRNCNTAFDTGEQFANKAVNALRTDSEALDEEAFDQAFSFDEIDFGVTDEELAEAFKPKTAPAASFVAPSIAVATAETVASDTIDTSVSDDIYTTDKAKQAVPELGIGGTMPRDSAESTGAENTYVANDNPTVIAIEANSPWTTELIISPENAETITPLTGVQTIEHTPENAAETTRVTSDDNASAEGSSNEPALADTPAQVTEIDDVAPPDTAPSITITPTAVDNANTTKASNTPTASTASTAAAAATTAAATTTPKAAASHVKPIAIIGGIIAAALICGAIAVNVMPHKVDYTAEYLDQATLEEIAETATATANVGDTVTVTAAEIDGYKLNGQDEQTITLQEEVENTVKFMYAKEVQYTVEYLDQDGEAISPAKVVEKHTVGEKVAEKAPEFDGYELTSPDSSKIKLKGDAKANVITFTYTKKVHYTVRYVDQDGEKIDEAVTKEGLVGKDVSEEWRPIDGYNLESADTQTITLSEDESANEITFTYSKPAPEPVYIQYNDPSPSTSDDLEPIPG